MSRFKFPCSCGKRMAAYDWMIGRVINCPRCGRTLTVPTPFQGEEQLADLEERGLYKPGKKKVGEPVARTSFKGILSGILGVLVILGVIALIVWLVKYR